LQWNPAWDDYFTEEGGEEFKENITDRYYELVRSLMGDVVESTIDEDTTN
jgi:hypothetical protein